MPIVNLPKLKRVGGTAISGSASYKAGFRDGILGAEPRRDADAIGLGGYEYGRLAAAAVRGSGSSLKPPSKANKAHHTRLLDSLARAGDIPLTRAVVAKRVGDALAEICGTIPPRVPLASLSFKRGLPHVPTYAELHQAAPEAVPATRRHKVPS
jgi:hypothetical protein